MVRNLFMSNLWWRRRSLANTVMSKSSLPFLVDLAQKSLRLKEITASIVKYSGS